jgi:hypothetical protein
MGLQTPSLYLCTPVEQDQTRPEGFTCYSGMSRHSITSTDSPGDLLRGQSPSAVSGVAGRSEALRRRRRHCAGLDAFGLPRSSKAEMTTPTPSSCRVVSCRCSRVTPDVSRSPGSSVSANPRSVRATSTRSGLRAAARAESVILHSRGHGPS